MVEFLDKDEATCSNDDVLAWFDEGVFSYLDKNNKDNFDRYFLHAHLLEYLLGETLGEQYLFHYGYM